MKSNETRLLGFYVENFKIISKGTWFELNRLNILTGANSSGKSTLFKAMKIFTDGFVEGDWPVIDIKKVLPESGFFENLLNLSTKEKHFCLGFRYYSPLFDARSEVKFKFVKGEDPTKVSVAQMDVVVNKRKILSFYSPKENNFNINYSDNSEIPKFFKDSPNENNPGEIVFAINVNNLAKSRSAELYNKHQDVFAELYRYFGDGIWTGELLEEERYYSRYQFSRFSEEFFNSMYYDYYCNLFNFDSKFPIFNDHDNQESYHNYIQKSEQIGFKEFIADYFYEFFDELSAQLRFFHTKRLFHLDLSKNVQKRIIETAEINFKILELSTEENPNTDKHIADEFSRSFIIKRKEQMYRWLEFFDLPGYFITKTIDNGYHQIFYVDERGSEINIADLGRGQAKLIQMMLAIGYKSFLVDDEDSGRRKSARDQRQIMIHIEEPEAYLHPKWQSLLADFFVYLNKEFRVQFLIETHSVYLIQKLQLLVARNKIDTSDITLMYFEKVKNDIRLRRIHIRKDGLLKESFGEGFYDESAQLAVALLEYENLN